MRRTVGEPRDGHLGHRGPTASLPLAPVAAFVDTGLPPSTITEEKEEEAQRGTPLVCVLCMLRMVVAPYNLCIFGWCEVWDKFGRGAEDGQTNGGSHHQKDNTQKGWLANGVQQGARFVQVVLACVRACMYGLESYFLVCLIDLGDRTPVTSIMRMKRGGTAARRQPLLPLYLFYNNKPTHNEDRRDEDDEDGYSATVLFHKEGNKKASHNNIIPCFRLMLLLLRLLRLVS